MGIINITNSIEEQITIGRSLFIEKKNIYTEPMVERIKSTIFRCTKGAGIDNYSDEDLFYISIYDYWTIGNTVQEGLYYNFLYKSFDEKKEYLTLRNRLIYTDLLNAKEDAHFLTNKYEAYLKLKPYYKRDVIRIQTEDDYASFVNFLKKHDVFVAKPEGASMSIGVHLVNTKKWQDYHALFLQLLKEGLECKKDCSWCSTVSVVCEEVITQSEIMSSLHPASINSLRVITLLNNDNIHVFYPCIKIGMNNEFISSGATGSLIAAVDSQCGLVMTDGKTENRKTYSYHPDTNMQIKGFQIPEWDDMISLVNEVARTFPTLRFVGWDVVHSTQGWCIMEGNYASELVCCQLPYQRGFRDEFEKMSGVFLNDDKLWWE